MEIQRCVTLNVNQFVCMMYKWVVCETYTKYFMQTWVYVDYLCCIM